MHEEIEQEDEELEKWEKKEQFVYTEKPKPYNKKGYRKFASAYGTLILKAESLLIGDFALKYLNILNIERFRKRPRIIIHSKEGMTYWLLGYPPKFNDVDQVISLLREKLKEYDKIKIENAKKFIIDLPNLYREINLDDLVLRTGLKKADILKIIETLILNGELKAEIRGDILKLKREPEIITSAEGYISETSTIQEIEKKEGMQIFVSYATRDADLYKIPDLARKLEEFNEIGEVLYWQEDMHDSIIEYMNDNLKRSDVVLLFCSPNALDSVPVKKEWMAAEAIQKPIVPVFIKPEHIPTLLSDRLGIEFDSFDLQKNVQEIYELILKKKQN